MSAQKDVIKLQELASNAWPAKEYYFLHGWILRFSDGATSRANSVLPLNYYGNDLDADILKVEEAYRAHGLDPIYMLHDFYKPSNLHSKLASLDYYPSSYKMDIMGTNVEDFPRLNLSNDFEVISSAERTEEWTEAFFRLATDRTPNDLIIMCKLMDRIRIPLKNYLSLIVDNQVIGIVLGILDGEYLAIMDLIVDKNFRRRGLATILLTNAIKWCKRHSGKYLYLQVVKENIGAVKFYTKLKLKTWYGYYYMFKK
jgi:ribosomal protein S18 acetylase RimI-like enzyme